MGADELKTPEPGLQAEEVHIVFPANPTREHLSALAGDLRRRRELILDAWRAYGDAVPGRNIAASLSRVQFNDHIPMVLESFSQTLEAWPEGANPITDEIAPEEVSEHGLQRWQQGYSLGEVLREWGYLQMCVAADLERYAVEHPSIDSNVMPEARRIWALICAEGVTASATQYGRLQQTESTGHVTALERALNTLHAMESARAEAWRTAAHDLRGSVTVVKGAATLNAGGSGLPEIERAEVADMLSKGVSSLHEMLEDLLSLARLEAGHEQRSVAPFDAAVLLRDFGAASQLAATDRGLYLKMDGPCTLPVEGDKAKVLRILQNLLLNAVKYTESGGISLSWGVDTSRDTDRWTFSVQDTGPGIDDGEADTIASDLVDATDVADDARDVSTDRRRDIGAAVTVASASDTPSKRSQTHGEGVGLSIVKRLCELLDGSLELATKPGHGSTFRVILPCSYGEQNEEAPAAAPSAPSSQQD
ncbi:MAG TPA: HAMP domain-containing sensor histidine kinase [Thermoanaerobaculia bacterium]